MKISREKHLDHMVKVVPVIVFGYALQCYIISGMNSAVGGTTLLILGALLCMMIMGFITYDIKHEVKFTDAGMDIEFLGTKTHVPYTEITDVQNSSPGHTFGSITVKCGRKMYKVYFIDEADKVKAFIEAKRSPESIPQAA